MSQDSLNSKIVNASKWSTITEVMAKLIAPISSMVLARVLTPEAFGVVATITMIISFAEIFTDAGFQRYLIQYEFESDEEKSNTANVAFWTNLGMSLFLWLIIGVFSDKLAIWVGNPGLGNVITIACVSIPLAAFSSIQMALYKRSFDFKTLFYVRLVGVLIPLFVTIPLALWLRSYWALVIGTIAVHFSNAVILTLKSNWRPRLFYDVLYLKKMFSFCSWTVLDTILVWATSYIDVFLIGVMLNEYYLGLYKTSIATVGQIVSIITAGILPVLMPSLSRVQNNFSEMRALLLKFQKYMAIQNQYPDYIVCMRVGDFYEVFGYGAVQVSELIELTLTSRDMGLKHRVPMVGFPYHRADVYYDKLTDKGLTLVIAENDDLTVKSSAKGTVNVETGEVIEMPEEPKKETMDEKRKREEKELIVAISGLFGNDLEVRL